MSNTSSNLGAHDSKNFAVNNRATIPSTSSISSHGLSGESVVYSSSKDVKTAEKLLIDAYLEKTQELSSRHVQEEENPIDKEQKSYSLNTHQIASDAVVGWVPPLNTQRTNRAPVSSGAAPSTSEIITSVSPETQKQIMSATPEQVQMQAQIQQQNNSKLQDSERAQKIIQEQKEKLQKTAQTSKKLSDIQNEVDKSVLDEIQTNTKKQLDSSTMTREIIKCRMSALYFIENYVSVPVAGGRVSMRESEQWNATDKYKIIIELFQQYDSVLYMSSRQSGKTTTSAMYLLWCMIFFPKLQISYLTLDKNRAIDMISRMKEMMDSLPKWLQVDPMSKAERMSYYELANGSKITASFVSGSNDPDKVGRGLSSPIVFIDETAFIPHAEIVWGALQPSVSAAKQFAKKNGYPNGVIFTSTPNGAGDNFFYNVYQKSVKFDDIYNYETQAMYPDFAEQFKDKEKNSFISVVLHWSEFRSQEWYAEQKKELNFNWRKINQELDLSFLGSDNSIFSDEVIGKLVPIKPINKLRLPFGKYFEMLDIIKPGEMYILGVDTAMSAGSNSDYSAITLIHAVSGKPIAEWKGRFSVVKRFAQLVKAVIRSLKVIEGLNSNTLRVVVERNSIGKEVVEELIYDDSSFDFEEYLFYEEDSQGNKIPGLYTSNSGKMGQGKRDRMFNMLMTIVNEKPYQIKGRALIDELRNLEQKTNGRIEASRNQHDDLVMSYNFCLYARQKMIDTGEIFIQGESKTNILELEADLLGLALSTGNNPLAERTQPKHETFVDNTQVNKMQNINTIHNKSDNLIEVMENIFVTQSDDEEASFNPDDHFIML